MLARPQKTYGRCITLSIIYILLTVDFMSVLLLSLLLTLNCMRYPALPLVNKGGSIEPPLRKPLSHRIFLIIFKSDLR